MPEFQCALHAAPIRKAKHFPAEEPCGGFHADDI